MIKKSGFRYINNFLTNKPFDNIYDNRELIAVIYKIDENIGLNFPDISGKLLALLIISIYQLVLIKKQKQIKEKNIFKFNENLEEVYLLNNKYLNKYEYQKIYNLIISNNKIAQIILNNNFNINDKILLNNIINNLEMNKLTQIDKDINQINYIDKNITLLPKGEDIKISKTRYIKIYKEFILINNDILKIFEKNFNIKYNTLTNFKFVINTKNILTICNEDQNIILIGNFNNTNINYFNINYILDYKNKNELMNEVKIIIQEQYDNYIKNHLIFSQNFNNDYVSPIFNMNNSIIGFGYKYNDNIFNDYSNYFFSNELINIIKLYVFYKNINYKLSNKNILIIDKFYLVNEEWIKRYKIINEYNIINNELNINNNIQSIIKSNSINDFDSINMRFIFLILKNMKNDINNLFNENIKLIKNNYSSYLSVEPDKKKIIYFDQGQNSQNLTIYNNFEIISSKLGKMLNDVNKILVDGIINNGKMIINLPYNLNNKDIWIIGNLNYGNIFIPEYILVYNLKNYSKNYLINTCKSMGVEIFLNKYKLINNSQPIIDEIDNFKNVGTIFKYKSIGEEKN